MHSNKLSSEWSNNSELYTWTFDLYSLFLFTISHAIILSFYFLFPWNNSFIFNCYFCSVRSFYTHLPDVD